MNQETAVELLRSLITMSLMVSGPVVGATLVAGVIISLFQAVTSIQEPTLSFGPKLVVVGLVIVITAPWMVRQLMQFTVFFINRMAEIAK